MDQALIMAAGLVGLALVLAATVYTIGWIKVEQQKTLRTLLERGGSADMLFAEMLHAGRAAADRRRGWLFVAIGLAWSVTTFFIGGIGWIFGALPVALGVVFLLLGKSDGSADANRG
ncbi:hypothetical protein [Aquimonas sp.]|jgi:hypothetical protein|uniref:hypothetical protein n=1 Tax=Aquimonas sp. TaxID=1872588 RepID=UPI0037BFC6E2